MSSTKRNAENPGLQRRVRARRGTSEEIESATSTQLEPESQEAHNSEGLEVDSDPHSESGELEGPDGTASLSFGTLAKAQVTLSQAGKKRKHKRRNGDGWENNEEVERRAGWKDHRGFNRSSKHAPTEISSKKAVSRKREVVPVIKRQHRDPRFEAVSGEMDDSKIKKTYSFLNDYREDEMKELKTAIKTTKEEDAKEKLKRALMSMESRKKAQTRKEKEQEILDRHRKEEKDLVRQGKQPFYLKKSEQRKRVLLHQYGELKGKQLDRVIERRRKKVEGKEKKKMPFARRSAEA